MITDQHPDPTTTANVSVPQKDVTDAGQYPLLGRFPADLRAVACRIALRRLWLSELDSDFNGKISTDAFVAYELLTQACYSCNE